MNGSSLAALLTDVMVGLVLPVPVAIVIVRLFEVLNGGLEVSVTVTATVKVFARVGVPERTAPCRLRPGGTLAAGMVNV